MTSAKTISQTTTIDGGGLITIQHLAGSFWIMTGNADFTVRNLTFSGIGIVNKSSGAFTAANTAFSGSSLVNDGSGAVTTTNCTFSGFGIVNNGSGPVTTTNCSFSGSGGIVNNSSTVVATNCTFSGVGFGIINNGSAVTVTNCTFFSTDGPCIINNDDVVTATNCTFSGCSNAIINNGNTLAVTNCIVTKSRYDNCSGAITDGGHNLDDQDTCGFKGAGCTNPGGTSLCNVDPKLDPDGLQDNGGPTQTLAVLAGSPAINAGDEAVCAAAPVNSLDQRGHARPGGRYPNCTIGAYEFGLPPPAPVPAASTVGLLLGLVAMLGATGWRQARGASRTR